MTSTGNGIAERAPVRLGICAMEKKTTSKPMRSILGILAETNEIEIVHFPERTILEEPIEKWPHLVDFLICFYSEGFPLEKAEAYVELRRPHCINNVAAQKILLDRRLVYALLSENGIPRPRSVLVERDENGELQGRAAESFVETDDYIIVGGEKVEKPFVEKPVDADNHNICIYYPSSAGGGMKALFRKVGDKSSSFDQHVRSVRRDGTYMYEPFMKTQGTDIKVYTAGPEYAHAEARKSPVVDGLVNRGADGKEMRMPVVLTPDEKEIASRVCAAFGQRICGFDLLRTATGSFVIDVNGWSFVKGVPKYYKDVALLLRTHMLEVSGRLDVGEDVAFFDGGAGGATTALSEPSLSPPRNCAPHSGCGTPVPISGRQTPKLGRSEELVAVLAVLRHGDRQPKNKMKMSTKRREFLELHRRMAGEKASNKEAKLKTPSQLQELLDLTCAILDGQGFCEAVPEKEKSRLEHVRMVLEEGGHFEGIYRKVQLKPTAWDSSGTVGELQMVLKYAGSLTPAGASQAEMLGHKFRCDMYSGEGEMGLLRLHATQRHDFKVYSSDEGRVQMSAASFTKGLLDLDNDSLTPICVALVETNPEMLDDLPRKAVGLVEDAKSVLYKRITGREACRDSPMLTFASNPDLPNFETFDEADDAAGPVPRSRSELGELYEKVCAVCRELEAMDFAAVATVDCCQSAAAASVLSPPKSRKASEELVEADEPTIICCSTSRPVLVLSRWQKLRDELWDTKRRKWNISKVPEIYDAINYDLIHLHSLARSFSSLYDVAKPLNDKIVPGEYGYDSSSRIKIGKAVCSRLIRKLVCDMKNATAQSQRKQLPERNLVTATQYLDRLKRGSIPPDLQLPPASPVVCEEDDDEEGDCGEAQFAGLDPRFVEGCDSHSGVRTRLYFTSESHIQTLMNVLRYCHLDQTDEAEASGVIGDGAFTAGGSDGGVADKSAASQASVDGNAAVAESSEGGIVCTEMEKLLQEAPVFDYLSHVVFRVYEDHKHTHDSPERLRVEVLFSHGAVGHPSAASWCNHTMPLAALRPLHAPGESLTLEKLLELLQPFYGASGGAPSVATSSAPTPVARQQVRRGSSTFKRSFDEASFSPPQRL